jgi:tRNA (guanine26-N2/guanine27-N2)-dimethyltransferase
MYKIIAEGNTRLHVPVEGSFGQRASGGDKKPPVFYNPYMKLNRSLCVLFMRAAGGELVFADVLAGCGAKGLRVACESGNKVYLNDANQDAFEAINRSAELNSLDVSVSNLDANRFTLENKGLFDFIDIDPFGSPVPFLDSALLSSKNFGYIGATATDTATLCGVYPATCQRRYQAQPLRSEFCHEVGLRILIGYLARSGAKYDMGIKPIFSHSTRHYFRLYVEVRKGVRFAESSIDSLGYLFYCSRCKVFSYETGFHPVEKSCDCGKKMKTSGPLWLGEVNEKSFLERMLSFPQTRDTLKLLSLLSDELNAPFYYDVHALSRRTGVAAPPMHLIIRRLEEMDFAASRTHFSGVGVKTNAPVNVVKDTLLKP